MPPRLPNGELIWTGTLTQHAPANAGFLVRPDGLPGEFGFGYSELELLPLVIGPSVWERLRMYRDALKARPGLRP